MNENGSLKEAYLYDDSGQRIKKWNGTSTVYYVGPHYEVEVGDGSVIASSLELSEQLLVEDGMPAVDAQAAVYLPFLSANSIGTDFDPETVQAADIDATTVIKYYHFNGMRIGTRKDGTFSYLHSDHLGGTVLTMNSNSSSSGTQQYCAYGKNRDGSSCASGNDLLTDHHFTGQKYDNTGLHYYNARYYDDHLGQFISPDTIVPDPTNVLDYNRYMMVRGNPVKYNDPSGHCSVNADGSRDMSGDEQCWVLADIIADAYWSVDAEWWTERFDITPEAFLNDWAKKAPFDENWMNTQIRAFHCQNGCPHWLSLPPVINPIPDGANMDPALPGTRAVLSGVQTVADDIAKCGEGVTQCGKALDDLSVALAGTAVTCMGLAAPPCAAAAAGGSTLAGIGGTGITTWNYFVNGEGTFSDIAVGATTTAVGYFSRPAVGFWASIFQRIWDE